MGRPIIVDIEALQKQFATLIKGSFEKAVEQINATSCTKNNAVDGEASIQGLREQIIGMSHSTSVNFYVLANVCLKPT